MKKVLTMKCAKHLKGSHLLHFDHKGQQKSTCPHDGEQIYLFRKREELEEHEQEISENISS